MSLINNPSNSPLNIPNRKIKIKKLSYPTSHENKSLGYSLSLSPSLEKLLSILQPPSHSSSFLELDLIRNEKPSAITIQYSPLYDFKIEKSINTLTNLSRQLWRWFAETAEKEAELILINNYNKTRNQIIPTVRKRTIVKDNLTDSSLFSKDTPINNFSFHQSSHKHCQPRISSPSPFKRKSTLMTKLSKRLSVEFQKRMSNRGSDFSFNDDFFALVPSPISTSHSAIIPTFPSPALAPIYNQQQPTHILDTPTPTPTTSFKTPPHILNSHTPITTIITPPDILYTPTPTPTPTLITLTESTRSRIDKLLGHTRRYKNKLIFKKENKRLSLHTENNQIVTSLEENKCVEWVNEDKKETYNLVGNDLICIERLTSYLNFINHNSLIYSQIINHLENNSIEPNINLISLIGTNLYDASHTHLTHPPRSTNTNTNNTLTLLTPLPNIPDQPSFSYPPFFKTPTPTPTDPSHQKVIDSLFEFLVGESIHTRIMVARNFYYWLPFQHSHPKYEKDFVVVEDE